MRHINSVNELVNKLIELRDKRKWSNYRIAKESDSPFSTIANIYNRKTAPQFDTLCSICKGFGITLSDFFNEENKYVSLTQQEKDFLMLFNQLEKEQQDIVINLMKNMNEHR